MFNRCAERRKDLFISGWLSRDSVDTDQNNRGRQPAESRGNTVPSPEVKVHTPK